MFEVDLTPQTGRVVWLPVHRIYPVGGQFTTLATIVHFDCWSTSSLRLTPNGTDATRKQDVSPADQDRRRFSPTVNTPTITRGCSTSMLTPQRMGVVVSLFYRIAAGWFSDFKIKFTNFINVIFETSVHDARFRQAKKSGRFE